MMAMFTKQHYEFLADCLGSALLHNHEDETQTHTARVHRETALNMLTGRLAQRLLQDNPAFDIDKFYKAIDTKTGQVSV